MFPPSLARPGGVLAACSLLCALALLVLPGGGAPTGAAPAAQTGPKLVLAFYYMWYGPTTFNLGQMSDQPVTPYISDHPDVIERQVSEAKNAGIDAFVSSWTGTGTETDANFPKLLQTAAAHDFQATIYFETNWAMQHGDVASQLQSALDRFATHPAFLHWNGKPVVFFWDPGALGGVDAWRAVRQRVDPNNSQIWSVDTTDASYLDVFDSVHLFSAGKWAANTDEARVDAQWRGIVSAYNTAHGTNRLWAAGVIPGWDESRVQPPRPSPKIFPRAGGSFYDTSWQAARASNPEWITVTSYNEWFEGTQIEPSTSYGTQYLDLTRQNVERWRPASPPPARGTEQPHKSDVCAGGTSFAQTGYSICAPMEAYWRQYGGLAQFGYPIGPAVDETSPTDGKSYKVQYFERARFELHPENAAPYTVLLGLVGRQFHPPDPPAAPIQDGTHHYFAETGHNVSAAFYAYWQQHGGLFVNGYPISEEAPGVGSDGKTYQMQYFERARYEWHPANAPPYNVLLGFLGRQAWDARGGH